ncbi:MAG: 50S ribosomal protein L1 [Candidatus Kerfeldbacteria bacterium]|nr:50S ribosomal protein L1 [Candidatus Kerfeldbacteria bacterium]
MPKHGKRYLKAKTMVEAGKLYEPAEAMALLKSMPPTKFDGSVEVHIRLGVDVKQANQQVRGSIVLPQGLGKTKRIAVFCGEDKVPEAQAAGAVLVGGEELIKEIQSTGKCDFDIALATPGMMKQLAPIAKILGQKGLMPNPKTETITPEVGRAVENLNKGKVNFKADDSGNLHQMIGRISFDEAKLLENFNAFVEAVKRARPSGAKGTYLFKVTLLSSMGPGVPVKVS